MARESQKGKKKSEWERDKGLSRWRGRYVETEKGGNAIRWFEFHTLLINESNFWGVCSAKSGLFVKHMWKSGNGITNITI